MRLRRFRLYRRHGEDFRGELLHPSKRNSSALLSVLLAKDFRSLPLPFSYLRELRTLHSPRRRPSRPKPGSYHRFELLRRQRLQLFYGLGRGFLSKFANRSLSSIPHDLERRLLTALYRAFPQLSQNQLRQRLLHGFCRVNGRRVTRPSYRLAGGDLVLLQSGGLPAPPFPLHQENFLEVDWAVGSLCFLHFPAEPFYPFDLSASPSRP